MSETGLSLAVSILSQVMHDILLPWKEARTNRCRNYTLPNFDSLNIF